MTTASIIIPVYNRAAVTRQCLRTLLDGPALGSTDFEVIVVDDASTDVTGAMLRDYKDRVRVLKHTTNSGFAATCNDGAAAATGRYLVFLNNDTIPQRGWLDELVAYLDGHPNTAVAGSKLLFTDGRVQHAGVIIGTDRFPWHLYAGFPGEHPAVNTSRRVQIVTGACMAVRRTVFEEHGGFDTGFRNGYEDVDLCLRIGERSHEIYYCHASVLYHLEAITRESRADEIDRNLKLYRSRWLDRVVPDDLSYYVEDGLLSANYRGVYPIELMLSPELATVNAAADDNQLAQVLDLQRRNTLLAARLQELEFQSKPPQRVGGRPDPRLVCRGVSPATTNSVSIVLCGRNAASRLGQLLPRIREQTCDAELEIVALDSSSMDETEALVSGFGTTVINVGSGEFTRASLYNLARRYVQGSLIVFLDQNALPADDQWLINLIAPLMDDPALAAVCSRVLPGPEVDVLARREILNQRMASDARAVLHIEDWNAYRVLSQEQAREYLNFHTLSAAVRPAVLERTPFFEQATLANEADMLWAKDVLEAGWSLRYEPTSVAFYTPDEGPPADVEQKLAELIRADWRYLEREDIALTPDEREHWRLIAAMRRTAQVLNRADG